jgi:hypothetical protein
VTPMTPFDTVFSMAGHSTVPVLALIHSGISTRYIIIFTEELQENMNHFESYLEQKEWGDEAPHVKCLTIGSIGDYETTYAQIKEIFDERSSLSVYSKGIFLQNGAKQLIISMLDMAPESPRIFLREPLTIHCSLKGNEFEKPVDLKVEEILRSRGLNLDDSGALVLQNEVRMKNMNIKLDERLRLEFTLTVQDKPSPEDIIVMTQLSEKFGRNGAQYNIVTRDRISKRTSRTAAAHINIFHQEEEE